MDIMGIVHWAQNNWVTLGLGVMALDSFLFIISPLTPWKWDDTLASTLKGVIEKIWPKKP